MNPRPADWEKWLLATRPGKPWKSYLEFIIMYTNAANSESGSENDERGEADQYWNFRDLSAYSTDFDISFVPTRRTLRFKKVAKYVQLGTAQSLRFSFNPKQSIYKKKKWNNYTKKGFVYILALKTSKKRAKNVLLLNHAFSKMHLICRKPPFSKR